MTEIEQIKHLQRDWKWVKLVDVCKFHQGYGFPKKLQGSKEAKYPFYKVGDISKNVKAGFRYLELCDNYIDETILQKLKAKPYPINTIVFAKIGEGLKLNRRGIIKKSGIVDNNAIGLKAIEGICTDLFLYHFFNTVKLEDYSRATTVPSVRKSDIEEIKFPLPPVKTQQIIVAKIEELFSELDKGIEALHKTQQQLKTYRQTVLKWAFEGKLTNENVKEGELPEGWKWKKLKEICKEISDGDHQAPPKSNSGVPFITISNVNKETHKIDFTDTFSVSHVYYKNLKYNKQPSKGDILYTVTGSFGIPILIDFEKEFCFQRHIGLIRPLESINQKWLYFLLLSPNIYNQAKSTATGTAQKTVALNSLRNFNVPYVELKEQNRIVETIESRFIIADKIEQSIIQSLKQSEALRKSILKKAFEGKLL